MTPSNGYLLFAVVVLVLLILIFLKVFAII
jgi:hypothetical protein